MVDFVRKHGADLFFNVSGYDDFELYVKRSLIYLACIWHFYLVSKTSLMVKVYRVIGSHSESIDSRVSTVEKEYQVVFEYGVER